MDVKGTAVRSTPLFVKQRFAERFAEWAAILSERSREIMTGKIGTRDWYPLKEGMIEPTRKICDLFFKGDDGGAWEVGRFSAEYSLWGLYRLFVKMGSPLHLIEKASTVFSTYYRPSKMRIVDHTPLSAVARIEHFPEPDMLVELRIGGWMERALEISGCADVESKIVKSLARGDECTEFVSAWR